MPILPDILVPNLTVVFCGTAVGPKSHERRAYYAGPGNRFWDTLHETGLTPWRPEPHQYRRVVDYGIGLTDLVKRRSALDADLSPADWQVAVFDKKIRRYRPRVVAFNGKRAAQEYYHRRVKYGQYDQPVGASVAYVLPSTSGAARGFWDPRYWHELAEFIRKPVRGQ